ncbi:hypothetical protein P10159_0993 [Citrobacter portucalensis]|nr:hypothetical protein P10159_0993 [Citrobacter portucalensis]
MSIGWVHTLHIRTSVIGALCVVRDQAIGLYMLRGNVEDGTLSLI